MEKPLPRRVRLPYVETPQQKEFAMPNPVIQFQILSKSPDETAAFYTQAFGWSVYANNPMNYRRIDTHSQEGIQGSIWPAPPEAPNFVQLFIAVEDLSASVNKAVSLGAQVLVAPTRLPEGHEMAVLFDPQGMSFGIYQRSGH